ncbi:MAG: ATP-binding protein, partial [Lachnospiraceae bacterium]|nr:ATP-binding protein [Lachnospiraceae bacterium]
PAEVLIDSEEEPAATGAAGLLIEDLFDILEVPTETAMEETAEEAVEAPVEEAVVEAAVEEAVAEAVAEAPVAEVAVETIEAVAETAAAVTEAAIPEATEAAPEIKPERLAMYNLDLEIPDPEPTEEEKKSHTIPLSKLGQNTVPISIEDVLRQETPEERRIRILNDAKPTRMNDDQRKIFTYFARIPGMDRQILTALSGVYKYAGEHTSNRGNIAVMGARGTGKTRLTQGLLANMCKDMGLEAAKVARVTGEFLNSRDMAKVVQKMSGGFLVIEDAGEMSEETIENLNKAMEFRTDCMIVILEAAKAEMRALLKNHPVFAEKFNTVINIPAFTNDELVTFARTYCSENNCQMDELGVLALYTLISNNQSEEEPVTIADVKKMVDGAISHAQSGGKRFGRGRRSKGKMTILYEKDFNLL